MFDVITRLMSNVQTVLIVLFIVATGAMMFVAYVKTRSTPAVLGMAALGVAAIVLVANISTVANLFGADVLGSQHNQVSTPAVVTPSGGITGGDGSTTATTAVCKPEFEVC